MKVDHNMGTQILTLDDARLRRVCVPVSDICDPQFLHENQLLKTALEHFRHTFGFGRGIAAPQLGIAKRFIALNLGEGPFTIVNPVITWRSAETLTMWDDCMCFPDLLVKVRRHRSISVQFLDEQGAMQAWEKLEPAIAELLQHEIDHLDGVLATDLAMDAASIIQRSDFDDDPDRYIVQVDYVIAPSH